MPVVSPPSPRPAQQPDKPKCLQTLQMPSRGRITPVEDHQFHRENVIQEARETAAPRGGGSPEVSFTHTHWLRPSEATTALEAPAGIRGPTSRVSTAEPSAPQETTGAAYGAVRCAGAHFVPSGVPAHLEDAAGASVAVDETSALQSKAAITRHAERRRGPPGCQHRNFQT